MSQLVRLQLGALLIASLVLAFAAYGRLSKKGPDEPETPNVSGDPIAACRQLAPEDPYTADIASAEAALATCREAEKQAPQDAEIIFMVGTSALGSKHPDDAIASFHKAEQLNYCQAFYFLGDDAWNSRDAEGAEHYYSQGAACGDQRAAHELFTPSAFEASAYPKYIEALYNSDMKELNHVRFFSASYVAGFYDTLSEQFLSETFSPCWASTYYRGGDVLYGLKAAEKGDASNILESLAYEKSMPLVYRLLFPDQGERALEEVRETARKAGHADVIRLVQSSQCGSLVPYKIVKGVETFARSKWSLLEVAQEVAPEVHSFSDLTDVLVQRNQHSAAK